VKFAKQMLIVLPVALSASVLTTAAQAAVPNSGAGVSHGCVSSRTGVLRVIDPAKGQGCITKNDRFTETAIEWTQRDGTQPVGVSASGSGDPAGVEYLDQLIGLPCDMNSTEPGVVQIAYSASGAITMTCQKTSTSTNSTAGTTGPVQSTETTTTTTTPPTTEPPA
jgi:hypothetical protein